MDILWVYNYLKFIILNYLQWNYIKSLQIFSMKNWRAQIQANIYSRLMDILPEQPELTQQQWVEKPGLSQGGFNYCIKTWISTSWGKLQNFQNSKSKLNNLYLHIPTGMAKNWLWRAASWATKKNSKIY